MQNKKGEERDMDLDDDELRATLELNRGRKDKDMEIEKGYISKEYIGENVVGIIRHIDDLGRIVIPRETRRSLEIEEGDSMEIIGLKNGVFLRKVVEECEE